MVSSIKPGETKENTGNKKSFYFDRWWLLLVAVIVIIILLITFKPDPFKLCFRWYRCHNLHDAGFFCPGFIFWTVGGARSNIHQ